MPNSSDRRPHIALMPTPGMGHLIPFVELAKLLVDRHHLAVTIINMAESSNQAQDSFLSSLPSFITSLSLPPSPLHDLPADSRLETYITVATTRSLPALRSLLTSLLSTTPLVAFVADLFGTPAFDAAIELAIPHYLFIPTNFLFLTMLLELPALPLTVDYFWQLTDPIQLPGFVPIPGPDVLDPIQDRTDECYKLILLHAKRYREAKGILVNTFVEIEPEAADLLMADNPGRPPVYPIGPLIQIGRQPHAERAECLKWLDAQPDKSVVFVSFGSGGTLSTEQTQEVALGLEASGQRFLWVVRSPSDKDSSATYFTARSAEDPLGYLPDGFLTRTMNFGLIVPSWAPQIEVLGHNATGGFVSHCGWNSTLESVAHGVPLIAWPLFAEQKMNAVVLTGGVKVAMRPKTREDGVVDREEVGRVVRELLVGEEGKVIRRRVEELKEAAAMALSEEGSSSKALAEVANKWKSFSSMA
ncbi:hydroquinone glucosyltransferase-like [Phalaenopsis equestris]|uniref:hydroquinone glucosyltransferase-like n=1 Tax=Phalaenopsis equestris TaxID=78828 RepID=UPI0009E29AE8|nr:hydroquinone glucosyltransferase-like [Phalaenopsis equestris]